MKSTASELGLISVSPQRFIHLYKRFYKYRRKIEITKTKILSKADKSTCKKKYIKSNSSLNYIKKGVHVNNYPGFEIYKFKNCALLFS